MNPHLSPLDCAVIPSSPECSTVQRTNVLGVPWIIGSEINE